MTHTATISHTFGAHLFQFFGHFLQNLIDFFLCSIHENLEISPEFIEKHIKIVNRCNLKCISIRNDADDTYRKHTFTYTHSHMHTQTLSNETPLQTNFRTHFTTFLFLIFFIICSGKFSFQLKFSATNSNFSAKNCREIHSISLEFHCYGKIWGVDITNWLPNNNNFSPFNTNRCKEVKTLKYKLPHKTEIYHETFLHRGINHI